MARKIFLTLSLFFILTFPIWAGTATHDTGQINLEIDDDGGDSVYNSAQENLIWPDGGNNHLFAASFMLGISSSTVLDGWADNDWTTTTAVSITESGSTADEEGSAVYGNTANNFSVAQYSYAWASNPNDDFVILKYVVTNTGATSQTIYLGIWIDYDVDGNISNIAGSDSSRDLAYIYESNYAGIKLLSGTRHSCNIQTFDEPDTDSERWTAMTNGEFDSVSAGDDDTLVLSAGPFTLASEASTTFGMAYVMGSSLADLQDNADAAQRRYDYRLGGTAAGGGSSEGCFIATSAYSRCTDSHGLKSRISTDLKKIEILQKFRDERLLTNPLGRAFVRFYYRHSPRVADFIRNKESLKAIVRFYLKPVVWVAEKMTGSN